MRLRSLLAPLAALLLATVSFAADSGGYLLATFGGANRSPAEQIYFALSRDGRAWKTLNPHRPALVSKLGDKGVRDPFLIRSPDGRKTYLLATDLAIHRKPGWRRAVTTGSRSIVVWESDDLANWSEPRLVKVAPDDAGCTWAPEAAYDEETGDYLVYWASTTAGDDFSKHRIWAARTSDFVTFGAPFVYLERDHPVIDTTIVRENGRYYRFTKHERDRTIFLETSEKLAGPWSGIPGFSLANAAGYEGPACFALAPSAEGRPGTWCLLLDHYARKTGYTAFVTRDLAGGKFTPATDITFSAKTPHGSVLAITEEEFSRVQAAFDTPAATVAATASVAAAAPASPAPATDPLRWANPLVPQRADPHVTLHTDGYYYLAATAPEYDRLELRRARGIAGLASARPAVIWRKPASGPMSASVWAPELHHIEGKWYVYFSAGQAGKNWTSIRPYVLEGEGENPLEARWTEKGPLKLGWESFSLDGTTFVHRGARYFVWTQVEKGVKGTNLYLSRMDTPLSIAGPITRLSSPGFDWERRGHWVNEGPAVLIRNGRVWMTYSASATDANYCLGLLSAPGDADLLRAESWTKSPEPVFHSDAAASQFGPGHNSFTTTPDGKTDILVYHARNYEKIHGDPLRNHDRATRAQVLRWRPDGSPDFGAPVPDGLYVP
jgi:GH43 family beta-xylosidase